MLQLMVMKNFFSVNVGLSVMRSVIFAVLGTTIDTIKRLCLKGSVGRIFIKFYIFKFV